MPLKNTSSGHGFILLNLTDLIKSFRSGFVQSHAKFDGTTLFDVPQHSSGVVANLPEGGKTTP